MTGKRPLIATSEELGLYAGVFPLGTADERQLLKARASTAAAGGTFRLDGEWVEHGLLSPEVDPQWSRAIHVTHLDQVDFCSGRDWLALAEFDFRLRWCRWRLDIDGLPYDRDRIFTRLVEDEEGPAEEWAYAGELDEIPEGAGRGWDPLDYVLTLGLWHLAPWHAAKVLAHYRRAEMLTEQARAGLSVNAVGLMREWVLFGETWATARYLHTHGEATVTGKKARAAAAQGQAVLRAEREPELQGRLRRVQELIDQGYSIQSAADAAHAEGLGTSGDANRRLWYRRAKTTSV